MRRNNSQHGSAIVYVLIGIILFGALMYMLSRSGSSGSSSIANKGSLKVQSQIILNYAGSVETAVSKLLSRGCSESQLNFSNPLDGNAYNNASAPSDQSCNIYSSAGGNVKPALPDAKWGDSGTGGLAPPDWWPGRGTAITDLGTTCSASSCTELTLMLWNVSKPLCEAFNKEAQNSFSSVPTDNLCDYEFTGNFGCNTTTNGRIRFTNASLKGKKAVCYYDTTYDMYTINYVILAR